MVLVQQRGIIVNTKDWIVTEAAREQLQKEKDAAFIWGYVCASFVMGVGMFFMAHWGIV